MRLIAALALVLAAPLAAQDAPLSDVDKAAVQRASERGAMIYAYDQAAWHGTDDLLAKLPDADAKIGGWVVDGPVAAPRLVFFDKAGTRAVYIAHFAGNRLVDGKVLGAGDDASLSPLDQRLIAAREIARRAMVGNRAAFTCTAKPYNSVVLPPASPDAPVPVYFLTPQTSNEAIPFGGHFEIDVDAAGQPGPVRRFSNSCIAAPIHPRLPAGSTLKFFSITHLLGTTPTEVHVFSSLALHLPVMVSTLAGGRLIVWPVIGAQIAPPRDIGPAPAPADPPVPVSEPAAPAAPRT